MIARTEEWRALEGHVASVEPLDLREIFADDPARGEELTLDVGDLHLDYSKNRVTDETLRLLALPEALDELRGHRNAPVTTELCLELLNRCREITVRANELQRRIRALVPLIRRRTPGTTR